MNRIKYSNFKFKAKSCTTIFIFLFLLHSQAKAQTDDSDAQKSNKELGLSFQLYPAGIIVTINSNLFQSSTTSLLLRAGGNFTDRKDYSQYNDNEQGSGFGASIGYRKHFYLKRGEIIAGLNTDLWNMWIHWKNDIGEPYQSEGTTYTLVLQPWLETGYFTGTHKSPFQFGITAGFGREINIITDGKDVGQGWMLSLLLHCQYSIKSKPD